MKDQNDLIQENETLTTQVETLSGAAQLHETAVNDLTSERDTALSRVTELEGEKAALEITSNAKEEEVTSLKTSLDTAKADITAKDAEIETLKADQVDFDTKLAAELAKNGIRQKAVPAATVDNDGKPISLTEQVRAAKGAA